MKLSYLLLASALALPATQAASTVSLQPAVGQASPHLSAALKHLDFGGEVFGYYDVDGELEGAVDGLSRFYEMIRASSPESGRQMPQISKNTFAEAFRILGLFDPKSFGVSSVKLTDGRYLNKTFLHTPQGRTGLLRMVGGEPHTFDSLAMAPASTQLLVEMDLDGAALLETVKTLALKIGGSAALDQIEGALKQPVSPAAGAPTAAQIFAALKTRVIVIVAADPAKTFKPDAPKGPDLPVPHAILLIEGLAPLLHPVLKNANANNSGKSDTITETETRYTIESKAVSKGVPIFPTLDLDLKGGQVRIATSKAFIESTLAKTGGFTGTEAYKSVSQNLPKSGNSLVCMNLSVLPTLLDTVAAEAKKDPNAGTAVEGLGYAKGFAAQFSLPTMTTLANTPDGILVTSNSPYSHKNQFMGPGSVVATGVLASMAIPAFSRVRGQSRQTMMVNDGRILGNSAQQYFLTTGKETVSFEYDPATGSIKGELTPWVTTIGKGYTIHDNKIEAGEPEAFSFSLPGAFGGEPVIFNDEGKTVSDPAQ